MAGGVMIEVPERHLDDVLAVLAGEARIVRAAGSGRHLATAAERNRQAARERRARDFVALGLDDEFDRMRAAGVSWRDAAERLGVSVWMLRMRAADRGLCRPPAPKTRDKENARRLEAARERLRAMGWIKGGVDMKEDAR